MLYLNIVFIIIFSIYLYWIWGLLSALKSEAPYVPMRPDVVRALVAAVEPPQRGVWVDLGSGDGRILIEACAKYGIRGVGIERIGSLRWLSRLIAWRSGLRGRIQIKKGDIFEYNLSEASVVSLYLLPETTARLLAKLERELQPGAQVVAHRFPIRGVTPYSENEELKLYVYRFH